MKLRLIYNHNANRNIKSEDYFRDIYSKIGSEYPHSVSEISTIYIPVEFDELEIAKKQGLQLINKPTAYGDLPHYIVRQITITFKGINDDDFRQDITHLVETFGKKAHKYVLSEERIINEK